MWRPVLVKGRGRDELRDLVYDFLLEQYPRSQVQWAKDAKWSYPGYVPLSQIKYQTRPVHPVLAEKVKHIARSMENHDPQAPIVLVRTPAGGKFEVADGYHRSHAAASLGHKMIRAVIGDVNESTGPWTIDMQKQPPKL